MFRNSALIGAAALAFVAGHASAQGFVEICADDIEALCANVEPGDGRVMSCLYAHSSVITDECHAATDELAGIMERFFDLVSDVSEACSSELHEHCSDVEAGGGRKFQCLRDLGAELSAGCNGMLDSLSSR